MDQERPRLTGKSLVNLAGQGGNPSEYSAIKDGFVEGVP